MSGCYSIYTSGGSSFKSRSRGQLPWLLELCPGWICLISTVFPFCGLFLYPEDSRLALLKRPFTLNRLHCVIFWKMVISTPWHVSRTFLDSSSTRRRAPQDPTSSLFINPYCPSVELNSTALCVVTWQTLTSIRHVILQCFMLLVHS
jgi:hypothetical protein